MIPAIVTIAGSLLIAVAIIAIFIPVVPGGPILSYISILLWYGLIPNDPNSQENFSIAFLAILGFIHFTTLVMDYLIPFIGKKVFHLSSSGMWGSIIGMIAGFFIFPPIGIVLGGVLGTLIGEFYDQRNLAKSLRVTGYVTLMNIGVMAFKIVLTVVTAYYFFAEAWKYYL